MEVRGITYDVGMPVIKGGMTRESLSTDTVDREMQTIANELNCNAVRITGQDLGRLRMAADIAARYGLDVWLSPSFHDASEEATLNQIIETARMCEELRGRYTSRFVLVIGCELSIFMAGFIPGSNGLERLALLSDPSRWTEELFAVGSPVERLNSFLTRTAQEVKKWFSGPLTYAAGLWEDIDWSAFDFVGIDACRDAENSSHFRDLIRKYKKYGKPIVVTEFGCCTYVGADAQGSMGWLVIDRESQPWRLNKPVIRDEDIQAQYLTDMLALFEDEGVEGAFVFTFVSPSYPSSVIPEQDLDTASYSLVRTWLDSDTSCWEPKKAFYEVARYYGEDR
ncbi:hypothetical protein AN477_17055 [Alicyclobacillus ferrooxydans]|uniref:Abortive infection protein n=1 Tax=Alicyclobacillus ferrooxydans TaxID=471514 RepID=A0A0P9CHP1_9BACL|nr:hypothetical protein AN477_17055 [Alicyclobacillus ferrooxydans]